VKSYSINESHPNLQPQTGPTSTPRQVPGALGTWANRCTKATSLTSLEVRASRRDRSQATSTPCQHNSPVALQHTQLASQPLPPSLPTASQAVQLDMPRGRTAYLPCLVRLPSKAMCYMSVCRQEGPLACMPRFWWGASCVSCTSALPLPT
jgi:hypothetical protein